MANVIGFSVPALFLLILILMVTLILRSIGPTTSARLNVYSLLRRGGWKEFLKGLVVIAIVTVIGWFLLAL